jgi:hypothetical protein
MQKRAFFFSMIALLAALAVAALGVRSAWAQEPVEAEITGTVLSIDASTLSFVVETADGSVAVFVAEGFDFTALAVGDEVEVTGTLNEDGTVAATGVKVEEPEAEPTEEPEDAPLTGTVLSIDPAAFSFVLETADGSVTVFVAEDFDFSTLAVGDVVEVAGTPNEDGSLAATSVTVKDQDEEEDGEDAKDGNYCQQSERQHPFGARLAERYGADYATLQAWFCDGFSWGQIMLALQTQKITQEDPGALLAERRGGSGWGQIWQERKLIGKAKDAEAPNDEDGNGRPDKRNGGGRPDQDDELIGTPEPEDERGGGRPDDAGRGNQNDHGRPDKPEKTRKPKR